MSWQNKSSQTCVNMCSAIEQCDAAYGSQTVRMVTQEFLGERDAALQGDPGTDSSFKVTIPAERSPMHVQDSAELPKVFSTSLSGKA